MNVWSTLAVVIAALLVGGALWWWQSAEPDAPVIASDGQPLFSEPIDPADVDRITITWPDARMVAERTADGWRQVEPVRFEADAGAIDQIIVAALATDYQQRIDAPRSPGTYGLATPAASLTLEGGGWSGQVALGNLTGAGLVFARRADDPTVYAIGTALRSLLAGSSPRDLRSDRLPRIATGRVHLIRIERPGQPAIVVDRHGRTGEWRFLEAHRGRASGERVGEIAQTINTAQIDAFIADRPDSLAAFGLDPAQVTVALHLAGGDGGGGDAESRQAAVEPLTETIRLGHAAGAAGVGRFAMWGDRQVVFTLGASTALRLSPTVDELRDPQLLPIQPHRVTGIALQRSGAADLRFEREAAAWQMVDAPAGFDLEPRAVDELLAAVFTQRVSGYLPYAPGRPAPETTLTLALDDGSTQRLEVAGHDEGTYRVYREGDAVERLVPRDVLGPVFADLDAFRERTIYSYQPGQIAAIDVRPAGRYAVATRVRQGVDGTWVAEADANVDVDAVRELAGHLAGLRAQRWIGASPPPPHPEGEQDGHVIAFTTTDGQEHRLVIDPREARARVDARDATAAERPHIAQLSRQQVADLTVQLRRAGVAPLDRRDIAAVITPQGVAYEQVRGRFERRGGGPLDEQYVGRLFDTLANLQARGYLDLPDDVVPADRLVRYRMVGRGAAEHTLTLLAAEHSPTGQSLGRVDDRLWFVLTDEAEKRLLPL